jgi:hypothetical protein
MTKKERLHFLECCNEIYKTKMKSLEEFTCENFGRKMTLRELDRMQKFCPFNTIDFWSADEMYLMVAKAMKLIK